MKRLILVLTLIGLVSALTACGKDEAKKPEVKQTPHQTTPPIVTTAKSLKSHYPEPANDSLTSSGSSVLPNQDTKREILAKALMKKLNDSNWKTRADAISELLIELDCDEAVPEIINLLHDENEFVRQAAAFTLGKTGYKEAKPELIKMTMHKNAYIRLRAIKAIKKMEGLPPELSYLIKDKNWAIRVAAEKQTELHVHNITPKLIKSLKGNIEQYKTELKNAQDWKTREAAAEKLGIIGKKEVIPVLLQAVKEDNSMDVLDAISEAFTQVGPKATPELIEFLNTETDSFRLKWVIYALGEVGATESIPKLLDLIKTNDSDHISLAYSLSLLDVKESIPEIVKLLDAKETNTRRLAIDCLVMLGAKEAAREIRKLLTPEPDSDPVEWEFANSDVREAAIKALVEFDDKEIIAELVKLLDDANEYTRHQTTHILGKLGARECIPKLIRLLKDGDESVRHAALESLIELGGKETIPPIIELLRDDDSEIRQIALESLGNHNFYVVDNLIKLGARESIPDIIKLLESKYWDIRAIAFSVICKVGAVEAIPQLTNLLNSEEVSMRASAADALGNLNAKESIPLLIERLKNDNNLDVRLACVKALGELNAKEAIPELMALLKNKYETFIRDNESFHSVVLDNLVKIDAREVIPQFMALLSDKNAGHLQSDAIYLLGSFGVNESIPELTRLLRDKDCPYRVTIIEALRNLGAKGSIPELAILLNDVNFEIRTIAAITLVEFGAKEYLTQNNIADIKSISKFSMAQTWIATQTTRARAALKELGVPVEDEK